MTSTRALFHAASCAALRARAHGQVLAIVATRLAAKQAVGAAPRSPGPGRP